MYAKFIGDGAFQWEKSVRTRSMGVRSYFLAIETQLASTMANPCDFGTVEISLSWMQMDKQEKECKLLY